MPTLPRGRASRARYTEQLVTLVAPAMRARLESLAAARCENLSETTRAALTLGLDALPATPEDDA